MQGPFCSSQQLSAEPWRCQMSCKDRETEGWRERGERGGVKGSPCLPRPLVERMGYNSYMMISDANVSGHKNTHSLPWHLHQSRRGRVRVNCVFLCFYVSQIYFPHFIRLPTAVNIYFTRMQLFQVLCNNFVWNWKWKLKRNKCWSEKLDIEAV